MVLYMQKGISISKEVLEFLLYIYYTSRNPFGKDHGRNLLMALSSLNPAAIIYFIKAKSNDKYSTSANHK